MITWGQTTETGKPVTQTNYVKVNQTPTGVLQREFFACGVWIFHSSHEVFEVNTQMYSVNYTESMRGSTDV